MRLSQSHSVNTYIESLVAIGGIAVAIRKKRTVWTGLPRLNSNIKANAIMDLRREHATGIRRKGKGACGHGRRQFIVAIEILFGTKDKCCTLIWYVNEVKWKRIYNYLDSGKKIARILHHMTWYFHTLKGKVKIAIALVLKVFSLYRDTTHFYLHNVAIVFRWGPCCPHLLGRVTFGKRCIYCSRWE